MGWVDYNKNWIAKLVQSLMLKLGQRLGNGGTLRIGMLMYGQIPVKWGTLNPEISSKVGYSKPLNTTFLTSPSSSKGARLHTPDTS